MPAQEGKTRISTNGASAIRTGSCSPLMQYDDGPFRRLDGEIFLEVHHIIPLSEGGEDTVANAEALCPNCHREKHFGMKGHDLR